MKRKDFLKNIGIGVLGLSSLSFNQIVNKKPVCLYDNYLKGVFAYQADEVFDEFDLGMELRLKREPKNEYDKFAISVYYKNYKLGYLAAYENIVLANLLDANVELKVELAFFEYDYYNQINIAVKVSCELISSDSKIIRDSNKRADDESDNYRRDFL